MCTLQQRVFEACRYYEWKYKKIKEQLGELDPITHTLLAKLKVVSDIITSSGLDLEYEAWLEENPYQ